MKKIFTTTFCTLMLCSLILITFGPTIAAAQEYTRTSYPTQTIPTIDGKWTTDDEWTDGEETWIGTDVVFRSTWDSMDGDVYTRWIVEFLTDTTDDTADMWRFCIDGDQSGGSEPQLAEVRMFEIYGHSNIEYYMGTEQGTWGLASGGESWEIEWADSMSTSSASSTLHWILEFQMPKETTWLINPIWNFFLQAHDASNTASHVWPPDADPDIPDTYGEENYSTEAIPEGLTFAVMALLTTVSMLVGYKYFIKRKETKTQ